MSGFVERLAERTPPAGLVRSLAKTRHLLRRVRIRIVPANVELIERTLAVAEARAIGIAAELDIAERIADRPKTSAELAAELNVDEDALERILGLLASTGCFRRRRDGRWSNNGLSSALRSHHRFSARAWVRFFGGRDMFRIWAETDTSVRTGGSATYAVTGYEVFDWLEADPDAGERFAAAMAEGSGFLARSMVEVVDLEGVSTMCDVGGGTGTMLRTVLDHHRRMRGTLFDLPQVVAAAVPADRMETVTGSFFDEVPAGCDRYLLVSVIHDWDDAAAVEILRNCRFGLPLGGRILVVEQVIDPKVPLFQHYTDVMMLAVTGRGRERSDEQFRALFGRAGLEVSRMWRLATLHGVYELAPSAG